MTCAAASHSSGQPACKNYDDDQPRQHKLLRPTDARTSSARSTKSKSRATSLPRIQTMCTELSKSPSLFTASSDSRTSQQVSRSKIVVTGAAVRFPLLLILASRRGSASTSNARREERERERSRGSETRSAPVNLNLSTNARTESQTAAMLTEAGLPQDIAFGANGCEDKTAR